MNDAVSENGEVNAVGAAAQGVKTGAEVGTEANAGVEASERPSLFCGLDGTSVNPHDAIPLDARDTFARNFRSHFAAALGETLHAA